MDRIERAAPLDLMHLALQRATVPEQFGAVLILQPGDRFDLATATSLLAGRVVAVPRLRQRVMGAPPGCGRAVWVDDADFAVDRHIKHLVCPPPGDDHALRRVAADVVLRPLPLDRPLWAATFVSGLTGRRAALILVVQHALADGLGGLAVLGALVDGAPAGIPPTFPRPPPSAARLATDALCTRTQTLTHVAGWLHARDRTPRPRGPRVGRAAPCSLLQPTGPGRDVAVAATPLGEIHTVAHQHGLTVNDVLLTAIGGALHAYLEQRGEKVSAFVVGIPVSERRTATAASPGNRITETRALIPGVGDPLDRLQVVHAVMRVSKKTTVPGWAGSVAPAMVRAAVALGVYDWYMRRQRYLHTVVTNVHGPDRPQTLAGAPITGIIPLAIGGGGNVTVTFAALSYADTLTISVTGDPAAMPDLAHTATLLQAELDTLTSRLAAAPTQT